MKRSRGQPRIDFPIRRLLEFLAISGATALASCGGGGGDSGTPPPSAPPATVMLSGIARFESVPISATTGALVYTATTAKPIRGATVEVLSSPSNAVLATTETDVSGGYAVLIPPTQSVRVRVKAQLLRAGAPGWDFRVRDNTNGNAQYALDSAVLSGTTSATVPDLLAGSGWTGSSYGGTRAAGPFAVLESVYEAHRKTLTVAPTQSWPALNLFWSINNRPSSGNLELGFIRTSHFRQGTSTSTAAIYILGQANVDTDEYDPHVVAHEFGHYLQWAVSRTNSVGGTHGGNDRLDMRVAFSEGWGNAWSGIVFNDPVYRDSNGNAQASGFIFNVSTPVTVQPGWYKEDSLGYVVWKVNEQLGFGPLWQALTGPLRTTVAATGAHLLAGSLKQVVPAEAATVDAIFASQAIATADVLGTTETNNGGIADALPVYKQYPGIGVPLPLCLTDAAGIPNKLGNYAFVLVMIPSARAYTIQVVGGVDPDFEIFSATFRAVAIGVVPGVEQLSVNLQTGTHVIAVNDFVLAGRQCFNLTIN